MPAPLKKSASRAPDRIKLAKQLSIDYSGDLFSHHLGNVGRRSGDGKLIQDVPNPFRADTDLSSSTYYIHDARFCDYGQDAVQHDWLDYYVETGLASDVKEAADMIIARYGADIPHVVAPTPEPKPSLWSPLELVPAWVKPNDKIIEYKEKKGKDETGNTLREVARWEYLDEQRRVIGYIVRLDKFDADNKPVIDEKKGKPAKSFRPLVWAKNNETGREWWKMIGFSKPHPLYQLPLITEHPDSRILVVSGEKCVDAANAVFERDGWKWIAITWQHGDGGKDNSNWSPVHGRDIVYWPDNDNGCQKAVFAIQRKCGGSILNLPDGKPEGWDIADAIAGDGWTDADVLEFISAAPIAANDNEAMKVLPSETLADNRFFSVEGISTKGEGTYTCHYFKKLGSVPISIKAENHKEAYLVDVLAPFWFFERMAGGYDTASTIANAKTMLIEKCCELGVFNNTTRRGLGVWMDNGRIVMHLGDHLHVDGADVPLNALQSDYRYKSCAAMRFKTDRTATADDGASLHSLLSLLPWANKTDAYLLGGWIFLAPLCGLLRWRPHIWLLGERGSGKTWTDAEIIKPLLSPLGVAVMGDSSEAGIRQKVSSGARPILIDEPEGDDEVKMKNVRKILGLIRQASSSNGFAVVKGTVDGVGTDYGLDTMFCLSSISASIEQAADTSRISTLEFKKRDNPEAFDTLKRRAAKLITPEFGNALVMRGIRMFNVIQDAIEVFGRVVAKRLNRDQRMGDQYGTLLAGAWCLKYNTVPTEANAEAMTKLFNWDEPMEINSETDAEQCLRRLMQHRVLVRTTERDRGGVYERIHNLTHEITVGEMVARVFGVPHDSDCILSVEVMQKELRDMGLWVKIDDTDEKNARDPSLWIMHRHARLSEVFAHSPFTMGWHKVLRNLSTTCRSNAPAYFTPSSNGRSIAIPKGVLFPGGAEITTVGLRSEAMEKCS